MSGMILVVDCGRTNLRVYLLPGEGVGSEGEQEGIFVPAVDTGTPPANAGTGILSRFREVGTTTICPADPTTSAQTLLGIAASMAEEAGVDLLGVSVATAGLAGYGREEDCRALEKTLLEQDSPFPWLIESDAQQTLRAAREEGPAVIALLGTGSAYFARDASGAIHRAGGHGAILEDHGSAFEISRRAILAMMRAYDGMGPESPLFTGLLESMGCGDAFEFRGRLTTQGLVPSEWARFAPIVLQAAENGETLAARILDQQLEKVVDTLWALTFKAGLPLGTPIRCWGGMVEKNAYYLQRVVEAVSKGLPEYPCGLLECDPFWGGWRLARRWMKSTSRDNSQNSSTV